jgi:hypothetical protein
MFQPENQNKKYDFLFNDIDSGRIKIPKFQRDFVWMKEQSAKLIDSIIKGFPIGTFIFWKTTEELRHFRNIGNINLPDTPSGEPVLYVLDGQQRITSLYAVCKGAIVTREGEEINYGDICILLDPDPDSDEQIVITEPPETGAYISVYRLLNSNLTELLQNYQIEHVDKIDVYKHRLTTCDFSTIVISNYPLDIACEIFTRINTGNTELTLFEIMVAKTFDNERNFDLSARYDALIDSNNHGKNLEDADFETIPAITVLQCVAACMVGRIRRQDILRLNKNEFIDAWSAVTESIFTAVDYIRTVLRIPVSQLLPYNTLLVPLTYFFYKNHNRPTTALQDKLISQFFWWASLSNRYSSGVETKMAKDLERMDEILAGIPPSYRGEEVNPALDHLRYKWFNTGDAFCKVILCLYAWFQPRSFRNDSPVKIDNSWLKSSTSKNYHHFFPRAYLRSRGVPDWKANSILNITIVDEYLNKNAIRARSPAEYMNTFRKSNKHLEETMKTHLIDDLERFGIWQNDYETFLNERGRRVLEELNNRLNLVLE